MTETATRDPRQIRHTVLALLAIMLVSGIFVTLAYRNTLREQQSTGRPPMVGKLQEQFLGKNQDGEIINTGELKGKFWFATSISAKHPAPAEAAIAALKRFDQAHPGLDTQFLLLSVDFEHEDIADLKAFAERYELDGSRWWVVKEEANNKFISGKLKLTAPHPSTADEQAAGYGELWYDPRIVLIDTEMHLRGYLNDQGAAENYFDFNAVADDPEAQSALDAKLTTTLDKIQSQAPKAKTNTTALIVGLVITVIFVIVFVGKQRLKNQA